MARKRKQAYKQTPRRRQLRSMGISLLPIIAIAIVTALYLIISARSAAAGLQIMEMHYEEEEILRQIANQRTNSAWVTSYKEMQKRAERLGFVDIPLESQHFMFIPGYTGKNVALLAPPPGSESQRAPILNDFYQVSLWEWFSDLFLAINPTQSGAQ